MQQTQSSSPLLCDYFYEWVKLYKVDAIRSVSLEKYYLTHQWLEKLAPDLTLAELNRKTYQKLLNLYAKTHEKQTTINFHHQLKSALLDAVEEHLIPEDPTRKIVLKGKPPRPKRVKCLSQKELSALIEQLELNNDELSWDWLILLIIKTGLRFAEALALTPQDFDFVKHRIHITKTWNYKSPEGGFIPTKNKSSIRSIVIDKALSKQFRQLVKKQTKHRPIFVKAPVFNSTVNHRLIRLCKRARIPEVTLHSLRHTHASILLFAGISVASVSRRLGHSTISTTQNVYLHIIQELEAQDTKKMVRYLKGLHNG